MSEPFFESGPLALTTPLGPDALQLVGLRGTEALSRLFRFELDCVAENERRIAFEALLGQRIGFRVRPQETPARTFWGICSRVSQGAKDARLTSYRLELVPQLWLLTRRRGLRMFQDLSAPEVLERVLLEQDPRFELRMPFQKHEALVQYRETDFDFVSRLMEEEGIFYFFRHDAGGHTLVVGDSPQSHPDGPGVRFDPRAAANTVFAWGKSQEIAPGKYTLWDHNFELPQSTFEGQAAIQESVLVGSVEHRLSLAANAALELYDYPGAYAQRFDGEDEAKRAAEIRMHEHAAASLVVTGSSTVPVLVAGHKFTLERHGDGDGTYVLTSVQHTARLADVRSPRLSYTNDFTCIPAGLPFRPPRTTPRPVVGGLQTAVVVESEGISPDKYGRVKVQFHWDREEGSSAWIRVSQPHASTSGGAWIPEVGDEVLVAFEHGDSNRPYVVGRVFNADDRPPERRDDDTEEGND